MLGVDTLTQWVVAPVRQPPQTFAARNDDKLGAIPLDHHGVTFSCAPVLHTRNTASHH